jgi:hypothetical protein
MSDSLVSTLLTVIVTLITFFASQRITVWLNKRKVIDDSNLSQADLVQKYQKIAKDQSDENEKLENKYEAKEEEMENKLKTKEEEKRLILNKYEELREELKIMDERHESELSELKASFIKEREENLKWKDWARRLVLQLQSYRIEPTPFDPEEILNRAKEPSGK